MAVSQHKQLMAAGGPQVLPTSDVGGVDAAVHHVLWCLVLQTSVDHCMYRAIIQDLSCESAYYSLHPSVNRWLLR